LKTEEGCKAKPHLLFNGRVNCDDGGGSSGGSGGSGGGGSSGGGSGSGSSGGSGGSGGSGSSGTSGSEGEECVWGISQTTGGMWIDCPGMDIIFMNLRTECDGNDQGGVGGGSPDWGFEDDGGNGPIGILPGGDLEEEMELFNLLQQNPEALIDIPCEDLPKWQAVSSIPIPTSVEERLSVLESQIGGLADLLSLNDDWELQELKDGSGTVVNMDEFSVNVSLPNSISPESVLEHIRTDFLSQLNGASFTPHPNLPNEGNRWNNPSTSLGSILSIDMLDDGSVICIQKSSRRWTCTTIEDPFNYAHPVSGNRQFGFEVNSNGSYTFYTRGVDRMTNFIEASTRDVVDFATNMDMLDLANPVWVSFQNIISNHVNSQGGIASINTPVKHRPDYDKLSRFLSGEINVSELDDCN